MKYFTAEIWGGWQNEKTINVANRTYDSNLKRYYRSLRTLAPRLGAAPGKFFTKHSLHDGRLLQFVVSDAPESIPSRSPILAETRVRIVVCVGSKLSKFIYRLNYGDVKSIELNTKNVLFPMEYSRFGDWGYDELLSEGKADFRHNILFQTGTEISIVFRRFEFSLQKATASALRKYSIQ